MNDIAQPASGIRWFHLGLSCALAAFLAWADGRLWSPAPGSVADNIGLLVVVQLLVAAWAERSRLGRLPLAVVNGVLLWQVSGWTRAMLTDGARRPMVLAFAAFLAAWVVGALVWRRLPVAWREGYAASRTQRAIGWVLASAALGGLVLLMLVTVLRDLGPVARLGVVGTLFGSGVGLALALRWSSGWRRVLVCWAILSLAWVALMTGLAVSVAPGAVSSGDWLLALAPPLIVGAVMSAYWRIDQARGA